MWILASPLTTLALLVDAYGLLWLIGRGGDEYPMKFPLSGKDVTGSWRHQAGIRNSEPDGEGSGGETMSRSTVILLSVVTASTILILSLLPDATLLVWCAWGLLDISGAWLLFVLVVGRRVHFGPGLG